ncbi:MAG: hypothetical protein H6821_14755 [Planctomycetaceae bacterium]|nr:hypothetical protein [Planctomycetaceae bacterium]
MLRQLLQQLTSKRIKRLRSPRRRWRGLRVESLEERALLASLTISITEASISENGGVANAIVTRDSGTIGDLVVALASDDKGEAVVPLTVTIPDGQDAASFVITGVDEAIVDGPHKVTISASAAGFDPGSDTIDITNDDRATLSVGDATVMEGNEGTTTLSFPVTLSAAVDVDVSVDYIT